MWLHSRMHKSRILSLISVGRKPLFSQAAYTLLLHTVLALTRSASEAGARALFDNLLVTTLNAAFAITHMDDMSKPVSEDLGRLDHQTMQRHNAHLYLYVLDIWQVTLYKYATALTNSL